MKIFDSKHLLKIDWFSPNITLYFNKKLKHSSIFSGLLSIVQLLVIITLIVYYTQVILTHKKGIFFYYKRFEQNPGIFELNPINFNHNLTINGNGLYDPKAITVIGIEETPSKLPNNLYSHNHWIYSLCPNSEEKNLLCLYKFYSAKENKMYFANEENFIFPSITSGILNDDVVPYTIIFKKCGGEEVCHSNEETSRQLDEMKSLKISFSNKYIELQNYKNPFVNQNVKINIVLSKNLSSVTNLIFNPVLVKTNGIINYQSNKEKKGYTFSRLEKEKELQIQQKEDFINIICLKLENRLTIYERNYLSIPVALSYIVGIGKVTWIILFLLNYFANKFFVYNDFGNLYQKNYFRCFKNASSIMAMQNCESVKSNYAFQGIMKKEKLKSDISLFSFNKASEYSFKNLFLHYTRCKKNIFIKNLIKFRCKILDEENLIKYYLTFINNDNLNCFIPERVRSFKSGNRTITQSFFEGDIKKTCNEKIEQNNCSNNELLRKQNFIKEIISEIKES